MKINRRNFVKSMGLGSAAIGVGSFASLSSCTGTSATAQESDEPVLQIGENIALADTNCGKVKGFILNGIYTYLGIPYAADPSGKNRFMPPQKMEPWQGVRPAVFYGNSSPQTVYDRSTTSYSAFVDHWNFDEISENCLTINVWTPAVADGKKRPVLVWLHGGGWTKGNGIEQDGYHGENISRYGDVVYCSINHRLGAFGFSDFSSVGGEKYKDSGNVGVLDMVAALQWVHDNIANFGGDPDNVTILGQSGGGSKVCTLATMPEVKGLVHKGVALSGSSTSGANKENAQKLGELILQEAGLKPSEVDKLQEIPWPEYLELTGRATQKMAASGAGRAGFGPIADGVHIPKDLYFSGNLPGEPVIPMLFCTTFHESNPNRDDASLEEITLPGVVEKLTPRFGEKAQKVVDAYAKNFPEKRPIELWAMIVSSRAGVVKNANIKLKQGAPVYVAWFGWCSPLFDGRLRAFHCSDISFWFYNTDRMYTHSGGGARPRKLSKKMADALLNFVKTGDPNGGELPQWPVFTEANGETMVLNDVAEVKNDPDREARKALES